MLRSHSSYKALFKLFPFPTERRDPASRKVWMQKINLKMSHMEKYGFHNFTTVFSKHLKNKQPTEDHLFPTENLGEAKQIKASRKITKLSTQTSFKRVKESANAHTVTNHSYCMTAQTPFAIMVAATPCSRHLVDGSINL